MHLGKEGQWLRLSWTMREAAFLLPTALLACAVNKEESPVPSDMALPEQILLYY